MDEIVTCRKELLRFLKYEIFGPDRTDSPEKLSEQLSESPLKLYGTGVLFPKKLPQEQLMEVDASESNNNESDDDDEPGDLLDPRNIKKSVRNKGSDAEQENADAPLNLANEYSPSALGISFRVKEVKKLSVCVTWGKYTQKKVEVPHEKAGQMRADGVFYPDTREKVLYQRKPYEEIIEIPLKEERQRYEIPVSKEDKNLLLHITIRPIGKEGKVVSLMLVNNISYSGKSASLHQCYFQTEFSVKDAENNAAFHPIDRPSGLEGDDELASLNLQYRYRRSFALGHGCAGDWERNKEIEKKGITTEVRTSCLPSYELFPVLPRETAYSKTSENLNLSMRFLSEGDGENDEQRQNSILRSLKALCDDYGAWISDKRDELQTLTGANHAAGEKNLAECGKCLERMKHGVELLAEDEELMLSFRLANRAMLMQQYHTRLPSRGLNEEFPNIPDGYRVEIKKESKWRPFQLAFVLMNLAGAVDEEHADRELIDLIWFPTGGGKTEAYLGLTAIFICLRRLRDPDNAGTTVLMRYTLRLLTAQQFERAAALILSLDILRQERFLEAELGDKAISIGLWVGQSLSPNNSTEALSALRDMHRKPGRAPNPFQVLECPWCKVDFTDKEKYGYVSTIGKKKTVKFRCPDNQCRWSPEEIPIVVIDEDIYEEPPTLLVATVDKFAQLAWKDETGSLFGIGTSYAPPSLIIQDELHLISGPLGTVVGAYETAIEQLCKRDGHEPKIVASTATIRRAQDQCLGLYNKKAFQFPPAGLEAGESYFAYEDSGKPGRLYIGVFGSALNSHTTAQVRVCSALLQGVREFENDTGFSLADKFATLVWYFNSLRELGHAATLCYGDIPEHISNLCNRMKIPPENKRYSDEVEELTSRRTADEIPKILKKLQLTWQPKPKGQYPVDVLLATNMISVGVDVPRLGLMAVTGQPKTTSEYIQATSRVGRSFPGMVVTVYNTSKSRDRSHYEQFIAYHQSLYRYVEPTSVTPFSPPARERSLRGVLIALARLKLGLESPEDIDTYMDEMEELISEIVKRADSIDPSEGEGVRHQLYQWLNEWADVKPASYGQMADDSSKESTLTFPWKDDAISHTQPAHWPLLTSMRSVDGTCEASVVLRIKKTSEMEE